jgi:integrase
MKGSITQRGKNSWRVQAYINQDGQRYRHLETVRGSKEDAEQRLRDLQTSVYDGTYNPPSKVTVTDNLRNWLNGEVKANCSQRTFDGYQMIAEKHLIPALGNIPIRQLKAQAIEEYYGKARERLSVVTVHHHHRVLSQSLQYSIRHELIKSNPCKLVKLLRSDKNEVRCLTTIEANTLLETARDSYYFPVIYTALKTGLRQGELLGLRWRDVNLVNNPSISVSQVLIKRKGKCEFRPPKTSNSKRNVPISEKLAEYLTEYRLDRELLCRKLGRKILLDDLVFTNGDFQPIDRGVLSAVVKKMAKKAGLEGVHMHTLRHTWASLMLLNGAKPKVVSTLLGHASVAFTLSTYAHVLPGETQDAMKLIDEAIK